MARYDHRRAADLTLRLPLHRRATSDCDSDRAWQAGTQASITIASGQPRGPADGRPADCSCHGSRRYSQSAGGTVCRPPVRSGAGQAIAGAAGAIRLTRGRGLGAVAASVASIGGGPGPGDQGLPIAGDLPRREGEGEGEGVLLPGPRHRHRAGAAPASTGRARPRAIVHWLRLVTRQMPTSRPRPPPSDRDPSCPGPGDGPGPGSTQ